jgi:hypothetical protein
MAHSARRDSAAAPAVRRRLRLTPHLALGVAAASLLAAGSSALGAPAATAQVVVVLGGYGEVTVDGTSYKCTNVDFQSGACPELSVATGTKLTFRARPTTVRAPEPAEDPPPSPAVDSRFVGWGHPECESAEPCTIEVKSEAEWVVAQFTPVWLEVIAAGTGTVVVGSTTKVCSDDRCIMGLFEAGRPLTVTAGPVPVNWGFGCDPYESDLANRRCVVSMANIRNFVTVGFGGAEPDEQPPYNLAATLRVSLAGDGRGKVAGSGKNADPTGEPWNIDCGTKCEADVQSQTQVRLRATAEGNDSEFVRWAGPPCASQSTCTFTVGRYPKVQAVFRKVQQQAPPPLPPPPPPPPAPPPPPPPGPEPPPTVALDSRLFKVSVVRSGAQRVVAARLWVNQPASARAQVKRGAKTLADRTFQLSGGTRTVRLPLRKAATAGPAWLAITLRARPAQVKTLRQRFVIPRAR